MVIPVARPTETGVVISWGRRAFGFARTDRGGRQIFLGSSELVKSGIKRLEVGDRVSFQTREDEFGKNIRAGNVRLLGAPA